MDAVQVPTRRGSQLNGNAVDGHRPAIEAQVPTRRGSQLNGNLRLAPAVDLRPLPRPHSPGIPIEWKLGLFCINIEG